MARPRVGDLSNAEWSHCAAVPLAAANKSAGLPSLMFPPTSLAAGVAAAHHRAETLNGFWSRSGGAGARNGLEGLAAAFASV